MATISESQVENVKVLTLEGGLTFDGVPPLLRPFEAATSAGVVVVNLAGVGMVTTPGISLLLAAQQRLMKKGGRLILSSVPPMFCDVLKRCKLDRVFTFAQDDAAAMALVRK